MLGFTRPALEAETILRALAVSPGLLDKATSDLPSAVILKSLVGCEGVQVWHLDTSLAMQANYLGSAVVNNVNVLDLILGDAKQNQLNGHVPTGRKLHQIVPGRTGVYQTGSQTIQVWFCDAHTPNPSTACRLTRMG